MIYLPKSFEVPLVFLMTFTSNPTSSTAAITDLRSVIEFLKQYDGEFVETNVPVDPEAELSGVYRHVGAGDTVMRPTQTGPALMFNKVKGFEGEHTNMAGIPTEASILTLAEQALPGFVQNVHCPLPSTGKYVAFIQVKKRTAQDEGRQREAALIAFTAFTELKHVSLVDEDVEIFDPNDVLRATWIRSPSPGCDAIRSIHCRIRRSA